MAVPKKLELTSEAHRRQILLAAANMFLSKGYTATSLRELAKESDVNIGSLMHLFENKENILCALVNIVLDGQFQATGALLKDKTQDKMLFWATETALKLHIAESSEQLRDLYLTAYSLPHSSEIIRRSTTERVREFFLEYNPNYQEKDFYEMEIASSGILRGFISVPCDMYFTMERKIRRCLETSFHVYRVPQEKIDESIAFVSSFPFKQKAEEVIESLLAMMTKEI